MKKQKIKVVSTKKPSLEEKISDADALMAAILDVNERLDSGAINVEHARALTGNFKAVLKLIDTEMEAAKMTGRSEKTMKRWFKRVAESDVQAANPAALMAQLQNLLAASKPADKKPRKKAEPPKAPILRN